MELRYLEDLWDDAATIGMDEPELLRYRSNLLGRDLRLTNYGGGNTSAKVTMKEPVTGEDVEVLWVKGSGGDLGTIRRDGFATVLMSRLNALRARYQGVHEEDAMADMYPLCTFGNNPRAASIDTPLHAFLPFKHVDHLHPDWAIALAASANGPEHLRGLEEETGVKLAWLPWKRPGFELGLWLRKAERENPGFDGIVLGSHGLFTWGETSRESYLNTLRVIDAIGSYVLSRVERRGEGMFGGSVFPVHADRERLAIVLLPVLRGLVGNAIGHYDGSETVMRFVNSARAKVLAWQGTSCPDHFVRTKVRPLFLEWDGQNEDGLLAGLPQAMERYASDYAAYYEANREANSPAMRSSTPSVVLIPGIGLFSFAKSKTEARITAEFYTNAIHVMEGATSLAGGSRIQPGLDSTRIVDNYVALSPKEAFNIEYWLLEEAKLKRMPPEMELSRKVAFVVGASPGMGHAVVNRLLASGAHVVIADLNGDLARGLAASFIEQYGKEVVGSESVDLTKRESIRAALDGAVRRFGGIDIVINLAAFFVPSDPATGKIADRQWNPNFDVNVIGAAFLAEEANATIAKQGTHGSIVMTSSANGVVPKRGSMAYDTSKAALNHLVRELAIEFAPNTRVNAVAPATVLEGSQMFPRERLISSLSKYSIPFSDDDSTETLRAKLEGFYAQRNLLKETVTPQKVAEALVLLCTDRMSLTTGHILPVDAGLWEAFLR